MLTCKDTPGHSGKHHLLRHGEFHLLTDAIWPLRAALGIAMSGCSRTFEDKWNSRLTNGSGRRPFLMQPCSGRKQNGHRFLPWPARNPIKTLSVHSRSLGAAAYLPVLLQESNHGCVRHSAAPGDLA